MLACKQGQPGYGAEGAARNTSAGSPIATLLTDTGLLYGTFRALGHPKEITGSKSAQFKNHAGSHQPCPSCSRELPITQPGFSFGSPVMEESVPVAGFPSEANEVTHEVGAGEHPALQAALSHTGQGQGKQTPSRKHHSPAYRALSALCSHPWLLPGPCITCLPTALSSATPPPPISSHRSARRTVTFAKSGFLIAGIVCAERSARQHMARNSRNYSSAFSVVVVGSDLGGHPSTVQTTRAWLQKPLSCLQQWQASRLYLESLGECCSPASY